jgi:hypothetical protein
MEIHVAFIGIFVGIVVGTIIFLLYRLQQSHLYLEAVWISSLPDRILKSRNDLTPEQQNARVMQVYNKYKDIIDRLKYIENDIPESVADALKIYKA